jgi:hypothetical protein
MNGGITGTIKKTQGPQTLSTGILAKHFGWIRIIPHG